MSNAPIDAVITWVDGHDKAHQEKLAHYLASTGSKRPESAAPTRFNQCGEIDYCVQSLLRFAPWLRTIFIVTDNQTPPIIKTLEGTPLINKIKLIDHREIFSNFENVLPTFNSLTIESVLWRIKGLSNQFIYLNDDVALIRPVTPDDFFHDNKLVLRGKWKRVAEKKWLNRGRALLGRSIKTNEHRTLQENTAMLAGFKNRFFHLPHAPLPINKQTFELFFQQHPEHLSQNIHYPVRNPKQFWPISLAQHLDIKQNQVIFDNHLKAISIHGASHTVNKITARLSAAEKPNVAFICMQSLDLASKSTQQRVFDWLDKKIIQTS